MTLTVNTTWYVNFGDGSTTGYYAVAKWTLNTAYTVGNVIRQKTAPAVGSERCFVCITAGTSSNTTEPTWSTGKGTKSTDAGGPVYMECTGLPALNADLTNTPLSSQNRSGFQSLGNLITNNTQDHYFICTSAGSAGAGEPTFNTSTGATTVDSSCTWTCLGAVGSFTTKWGSPLAHIQSAFGTNFAATGDTVYVSSISAETGYTNQTLNFGSLQTGVTKVICVSNTGSIPPGSADITTGASITCSTSLVIQQLTHYFQGVSFIVSGTGSMTIPNSGGDYLSLENSAFNFTNTSNTSSISLTQGGNRNKFVFNNVTVECPGTTAFGINLQGGNIIWKNTASMLSKAGSNWPTTLFDVSTTSTCYGTAYFENCDLSAFAGTQYFGTNFYALKHVFNKCKFSTSTICNFGSLSGAGFDGWTGGSVDLIDCDSGGNTYRHERYTYEGQHVVSTTAVYTGGASNGTTAYSWQVSPSANAQWLTPFECLPMAIWNSAVAANRTVTVQGIYNGAALPNNDQIWIEVCYFGTSSSTLGTRNNETKATYLASGTPLTANTSAAWNSAATARANTHAYNLGDLISVGTSAAGQLYICTTAGTSSGSPPVGYASCSDGSTVNDGTAVFRAMMRFLMTVTLSTPQPQSAGYFNVYVKAALASATFFVDPSVALT